MRGKQQEGAKSLYELEFRHPNIKSCRNKVDQLYREESRKEGPRHFLRLAVVKYEAYLRLKVYGR